MKKLITHFPRLLTAATILVFVSCNSAQTHDDNDRTKSENGSSHPNAPDTSMTDTTRTATSGVGNNTTSATDPSAFIAKNISDNMMEIELSKMGKDKGENAGVKKLATQMVADHTLMLGDLKTLAGKKQVSIPIDNKSANDQMQAMGASTGKEFDKMWVSQMLMMHEAKLAELQNVVNQTTDADVKNLATKAQFKVTMHRDMLIKMKNL